MSTESDIAPGRRRPSTNLAHDLVSDLTQQIMRGLLKPGDKLPSESTIVRAHGVSRTVVREAISKLQAAGWVETHHGVGSFVLERQDTHGLRLNVDTALSVRDILELRLGLETQAVALAARRRSAEQLAQMRQALDDYQQLLANNDSCVEADQRFHLLIAEATGNPYFVQILQSLGNALIPGPGCATPSAAMSTWRNWRPWPTRNTKPSTLPSAARTRMRRGRRCGPT